MSAPDTEFNHDGKPHEQISKPTVQDREISKNNFGAGFYSSDEVYLQTQRFKKTLNANASVGQGIHRLALGETLLHLARQGWTVQDIDENTYDIPPFEDASKGPYEDFKQEATGAHGRSFQQKLEYGRLVFESLPDYVQDHAVVELSSLDEPFDPPEMRITKFFHEATRSKGGRLMDNVFGRVKKLISPNSQAQAKKEQQSLLRNRGGL